MRLVKGKHAVKESYTAGLLDRVLISSQVANRPEMTSLINELKGNGVKIQRLSPHRFNQQVTEANHQGIVGYVRDKEHVGFDVIVANPDKYPFLVVLDHIEDPYNFGGILRTCEALGVSGVVYPKDRNTQLSAGVAKAASGAASHLNLLKVVNVSQAIRSLKKAGYWVMGTDVNNGTSLTQFEPQFPLALVLGNESKGQSRLVSSLVDDNLLIDLKGNVESLNVSVATGILVHHISQQLD